MKKTVSRVWALLTVVMIAGMAFVTVSCAGDEKKEAGKGGEAKAKVSTEDLPNYRYVDMDSLIKGYNLAKDYDEQFLTMQSNLENTYRQKSNSIQSQGNSLQKEYEKLAAGSTPLEQQQFEQKMKNFQSMQSNAEKEMGKMQEDMQKQFVAAQKEISDSIKQFIESYNATRGYDAIFDKAAALYIDPRLDITNEVLEGLNKRYNKK